MRLLPRLQLFHFEFQLQFFQFQSSFLFLLALQGLLPFQLLLLSDLFQALLLLLALGLFPFLLGFQAFLSGLFNAKYLRVNFRDS